MGLPGSPEQEAFRDAEQRVDLRRSAARALGVLAPGTPSAGDAVSVLAATLDDPDEGVNQQTVLALLAFGPAARAAAPTLIRAIRHAGDKKDLWRAGRLVEVLGRIEPTAVGAGEVVAFLDKVLDSRDLGPRLFAQRVLGSLGPVAAPAIPRLIALSRRPIVRASEELGSVATALAKIAPGTADEGEALAALEELLRVEPKLHHIETIIDAVGRFRPDGAAALHQRRQMMGSGDPQVSEGDRKGVATLGSSGR